MATRFGARVRALFVNPLPKAKVNLYVALASGALALIALIFTGRVFQLERRDALLFELEHHYQDYEQLLLTAECFIQNAPTVKARANEMDRLRQLNGRLRADLLRRSEATLGELLDTRDEVLTVGSEAAVGLARRLMNERSKLDTDGLERVVRACSL